MTAGKSTSNAPRKRPDFSKTQLQELKTLNVLDTQIHYLRQRLVTIRAWRTKSATLTEVRAEFSVLRTGLEAALSASRAVLASTPELKAISEVHLRLANARVKAGRDDYPLQDLCAVLERELDLVRAAESTIGTTARRFRSAAMQPIAWIESDLEHGWAEAHTGIQLQQGYINLTEMRPFRHQASRSDPFARIAGICFEACAGVEGDADGFSPEASIKAYLKFKRRDNAKKSGGG